MAICSQLQIMINNNKWLKVLGLNQFKSLRFVQPVPISPVLTGNVLYQAQDFSYVLQPLFSSSRFCCPPSSLKRCGLDTSEGRPYSLIVVLKESFVKPYKENVSVFSWKNNAKVFVWVQRAKQIYSTKDKSPKNT